MFLVGPNASGKSNFLDAFRFLREVADPEGGFQRAVRSRGGVSQLRSLHARRYPNVVIEVGAFLDDDQEWSYRIDFTQDNQRNPIIKRETIKNRSHLVLNRPDDSDKADPSRLTQTHLEQVNANKAFRQLQDALSKVQYLHIVPQLVREPERSVGLKRDPYGGDFLEQLASTPKRTLDSRLTRIRDALKVAVPQLAELELKRDVRGVPHLRGLYTHWRKDAGWQTEDQFSDGTLRLLGLLWVLLDGNQPLLLEEPELSLHPEVVRYIPTMMAKLSRKSGRQIIVSTHSQDLLSDTGISSDEILMLQPTPEDTKITEASEDEQVQALLIGGLSAADAVLPRTAPTEASQLSRFGD